MDLAKMAFAVAMVAAASGVLDARAADFPLAGGDLSLAGNWGGEMPGKSASVAITNDGTYTASSDLAFGSLSVNAADVTFDFSQTPTRKVVFDGSAQKALTVAKARSQTVFKGGEWSVADGWDCIFYCGTGDNQNSLNNHEVVLDNCVWTNLSRVYMGQAEGACRMDMRNSSRVYAKQCFVGNGLKTGNRLFVSGGSEMHLSHSDNPFYSDNGSAPSSDTGGITVSGEGSLLSAPSGIFQVGNSHPDIHLDVTDKASVVAGSFVVGRTSTSKRCRVQVADGASFAANVKIEVKGEDSRMIVSNATLTVNSANNGLTVGCAGLQRQSFSLSGADSSLSFFPPRCDVFAAGAWNAEFSVENGAKWSLPEHARIAIAATNCAFRVADGGEVTLMDRTGTFEFGPGSGTDNPKFSVSNRIEVCGGGTLGIGGLRLSGTCNSLVVSNATVVCETRDDDNVLHIGYSYYKWAEGIASTNCALVLRGKTPKISAPGTLIYLYSGSVLKFEIPEDGYEKGFVPLEIKHLGGDGKSGTGIEIDCEDFVAKTGGKLTLATVKSSTGLTSDATDAMLKAAAAKLPPECTLSWTDRKLVLQSPRRCGFFISVR